MAFITSIIAITAEPIFYESFLNKPSVSYEFEEDGASPSGPDRAIRTGPRSLPSWCFTTKPGGSQHQLASLHTVLSSPIYSDNCPTAPTSNGILAMSDNKQKRKGAEPNSDQNKKPKRTGKLALAACDHCRRSKRRVRTIDRRLPFKS